MKTLEPAIQQKIDEYKAWWAQSVAKAHREFKRGPYTNQGQKPHGTQRKRIDPTRA